MRRVVAGAIVAILVLAGCSSYNDKRGRGDAPVGDRDDRPARVIFMPDNFANIAFKCIGSNGLYVTTREAAPVVIPNDSNCTGGK